jgi:hypothetical protein
MGFLPKIGGGGSSPASRADTRGETEPPTTGTRPSQPPGTNPTGTASWSPTVKVDGADRRTQMRMGTDAASMAAQNNMPIACPVLKALVAEGSVHVDANGRVQTAELLQSLQKHGMTEPMLKTIQGITYFANRPTDIPKNMAEQSFDIMHLRSGMTMHDSDSNILSQGHFDQAAFDRFTSGAKNGYMDEAAFADAVRRDTHGDMKAQNPLTALSFGQNAVLSEYPVLLKLLGTKGPDGKPAVKVDDLKAFWKDGTFPTANVAPGSVGMLNSGVGYATMLSKVEPKLAGDTIKSIATSTGLAREGVRLSTDRNGPSESAAAGAAGKGAGAAAKCPFLNGSMPMPTQMQAAVDVHNNK